MIFKSVLGLLGLATLARCAMQQPLRMYDEGLFTPVEELNILSASAFTTLQHPAFPNYEVRIKKSNWCDGTVA